MATSSSIDFNVTARDLISFALLKLGVIGPEDDPSAAQLTRGVRELNLLLKSWMKYASLWRMTEGSFTSTEGAATTSYSLSPAPLHVTQLRYSKTTATESELLWIPRGEYFSLANKSLTGTPQKYYVDYQRTSATMYIHPVNSSTGGGELFDYTYIRKFEDIDTPNNDVDIRQEWFDVVGWNLAARLASDYGKNGQEISARASALLNEALGVDGKDPTPLFPPTSGN